MKKQLLAILGAVTAISTLCAEEVYIPVVHPALAILNAEKAKLIKDGDIASPGQIQGKFVPGIWKFSYVKSGNTPADFTLEGMKAKINNKGMAVFSTPKNSINFNRTYGSIFNNSEGIGFALSFVNPSKADMNLEIDGSLRLYHYDPKAPFHVYVYTLDQEGKREEVISTVKNPDLVYTVKFKNSQTPSYYFRYTADAKLKPGAELVTAFIDKGIKKSRTSWPAVKTCLNEGVGRQYLPKVILKSEIR